MRLVVDTNVFVSAGLKQDSLPNQTVFRIAQDHSLLKSIATEMELTETLARAAFHRFISAEFRSFLAGLLARAEPILITERVIASRDPRDDKFLELAVNGGADMIVTGDRDLLVLSPFRNIPIVAPAAFVRDVAR